MNEHPLDRKLREQAQTAQEDAAISLAVQREAAAFEAGIAATRARTEAAWPLDRATLESSMAGWTERFAAHKLPLRLKYINQGRSRDVVHEGQVHLHDTRDASDHRLHVMVLPDGQVCVSVNGIGRHTFQVGKVSVDDWDVLINRLHDLIRK